MTTNVKYLDPKADFKRIFGKSLEEVKISAFTEEELRAYDKFWDRVSSEKTLMEGRYDEGLKQGLQQGMQQGEANKALEIARAMKADGLDEEFILRMTGVRIDEMD